MSSFTIRRHFIVAVLAGSMACAISASAAAAPTGKTFATPEKALEALIGALRTYDPNVLLDVLGKDSEPLFLSTDPAMDASNRQRFLGLYDAKHDLAQSAEGLMVLTVGVGAEAWPFPIPLVKTKSRWAFDTEIGFEEIINRRIGRNELQTIQTCLAVVDAEREYYSRDRDGDGILEFARAFASNVGLHNGLFWPAEEGEPLSPLGELIATAAAEGYAKGANAYHGYHYRILSAQGPAAPGGAYDYRVRDNQIGGFAILAYPASYGDLGVMSFIVNHDGLVYQRDLGEQTEAEAAKITTFDPVEGWIRVADKDLEPIPED
jgi:hypothetical protein